MDQIEEVITQYIDQGNIIDRVQDIQELLPPDNMGKSWKRLVSKALKEGFNMTYRRILRLSWK